MTNGKVYVGSNPYWYAENVMGGIPTTWNHTFLFRDEDGDLDTTNDQFVIQGIPSGIDPFTNEIVIMINAAGDDGTHVDLDTDNDGEADIAWTSLNLVDITSSFGGDGAVAWANITQHVEDLGEEILAGTMYQMDVPYHAFTTNCNTWSSPRKLSHFE